MAMVWALVILKKDIAERYLDIEEYDESGSPIKISDPNQYIVDGFFKNGLADSKPIRELGGGGSTYIPIFDFGDATNVYKQRHHAMEVANGGWNFL